ncbi:hypothetical protein MTO96_014980 [Rhipicephalus appendiculatus]
MNDDGVKGRWDIQGSRVRLSTRKREQPVYVRAWRWCGGGSAGNKNETRLVTCHFFARCQAGPPLGPAPLYCFRRTAVISRSSARSSANEIGISGGGRRVLGSLLPLLLSRRNGRKLTPTLSILASSAARAPDRWL